MPLFSVIMPAYNRERFIVQALRSVQAQTCPDWECVVVDDGSTDHTTAKAQEFAANDCRIRLVSRLNGGPGAARNQGANAAQGRYLAFLDSDDLWMPYTLETYRGVLEQAGWPEYLAGRLQDFSLEADLEQWHKEPMHWDLFPDSVTACSAGSVVAGAGMTVVSAGTFRRSGGFLEDRLNAEDHDFTMRLGNCRGFVAVRSPVTVGYRRHGEQETGSQERAVAGILRLMERERSGAYPGGPERAGQRRSIIATHARPVCLASLRSREFSLAWRLYRETFLWQMQAGRWRFLAAFPVIFFRNALKRHGNP